MGITAMNSLPESAPGFTLIEVLVVLMIVSILAGVTVFNLEINSPRRILGREAQRLQSVLGMAAEAALLQGAEYGLLLGEKEYQVLKFDAQGEQWRQTDSPIFRLHRLPDAVDLVLEMEDHRFSPEAAADAEPGSDEQQDDEKAGTEPHILMFSNGELTPFEIYLGPGDGAWGYRVMGDGIQTLRLEKTGGLSRAGD